MNGQWLGTYAGTNSGRAVVEIDDMDEYYFGGALMYDNNISLPSTFGIIKTDIKTERFSIRVPLSPIDPRTGNVAEWAHLAPLFPNVTFPTYADVEFNFEGTQLSAQWTTDIGTFGRMTLPKSRAGEPSEYPPLPIHTWVDFKEHVRSLGHHRFIFRGQESNKWRLRTSYHRTGRAFLPTYMTNDIPTVWKHLSARTRHVFDLTNAQQNGAFFSLIQHHGYPTPLLDWTYSPFVAAYFAYHKIKNSEAIKSPVENGVRIFLFNKEQWFSDFPQFSKLAPAPPHVSLLDALAIENNRMIPQQALSTITNIDDMETYIQMVEASRSKTYLQMIDLPVTERPHVMRELSVMGITAGSLFPGLDGACEELKERFFPLI